MNTLTAARSMLDLMSAEPYGDMIYSRDSKGRSVKHAIWMLCGITLGYIQDEKAHRWLGYAQGILVVQRKLTLEEMKNVNRTS